MTLPEGWAEATVDDLGEYVNGMAFKPTDWGDDGIGIIRIQNLTAPSKPLNRTKRLFDERYRVRKGDLLVSWSATLDAFIWDREDAVLNQHIFKVTPSECADSRFLFFQLRELIAEMAASEHLHGSTMKHINRGPFLAHSAALPPLAEQRRIVAKLDALTARLARARAELDRVPVLAANLRKETLRNAFGHGAATVPVGDLITDIRYGTAKKCDYGGGAVPVLRIPNVQGGRIDLADMKSADFDAKELAKLLLRHGDILVIRSNGSLDLVGRSAIVDDSAAGMLFAGYLIRMRVEPAKCLPEYLHHFLQSPVARDTITMASKSTSGVNNVNAQQLQALAVPLPDLATQRTLIDQIEQSFARADRLEAEATRARALLDRLESALLAKAFRGELVPQDPNDEPAQALLDRIRQQRAAAPKAKRGRRTKASA